MTFNPAPENHGYKIQRIDQDGMPIIDAIAENVVDTQRGTVLGKGDIRVSTVEHGLSALYALGVDNCLIQVNGPEFPILDGSAIKYVEKIREIGIEEQNAPKDYYVIRKKIEVKDEDSGSCITILPDDEFSLTTMCSFESKFINSQFATIDDIHKYAEEIAPARTFVFVRDLEPLLQANLIKGGDLDNAIVIYERQTTQERLDMLADMLHVEHRDATELGYVQHKPLVWENECTRHKLLDVIGDMALIGKPIKGRIVAIRPGHTINNKVARELRKEIRKHEIQAPFYDPNEEPVMDVNRIRELLPHRYPMQLVDKVIEIYVPDEKICERLSGRRVCEGCGASYHIEHKPTKKEGICDSCGAKVVQRTDDKPETVLSRLATYHEKTAPLKEFYEKRGKLRTVVGQDGIADTAKLTLEAIEG